MLIFYTILNTLGSIHDPGVFFIFHPNLREMSMPADVLYQFRKTADAFYYILRTVNVLYRFKKTVNAF